MGEREAVSSSDDDLHDNLETSSTPGTSGMSGNTVVLKKLNCFAIKMYFFRFSHICIISRCRYYKH